MISCAMAADISVGELQLLDRLQKGLVAVNPSSTDFWDEVIIPINFHSIA